jgi:hypothetical protein
VSITDTPAEELARQMIARRTFPLKVELTQAIGVRGKGDDITYDHSISASLTKLAISQHEAPRSAAKPFEARKWRKTVTCGNPKGSDRPKSARS